MSNQEPACPREEMGLMCELCFPNSIELGQVMPDYSLILHDGKYHILGLEGHRDHIVLSFNEKPFPDPDPTCENEDEEILALEQEWLSKILNAVEGAKLPIYEGYKLVQAATKAGWDPEDCYSGSVAYWLANKCGEVVRDFELANP